MKNVEAPPTHAPQKEGSFLPHMNADTSTQISNLGNPAHRCATEGLLQKEAMFYTDDECKSSLQGAFAEKRNNIGAVFAQQSCIP